MLDAIKVPNPNHANKIRFECYICKIELGGRQKVKSHMTRHTAARDQKCSICNESLTVNELNEHMCSPSKTTECDYCDSSFSVTAKLLQHLETEHTDRTLYRCRKCPRFFGTIGLRSMHEENHVEQETFRCRVCKKAFPTRNARHIHMQLHPESESMCIDFFSNNFHLTGILSISIK